MFNEMFLDISPHSIWMYSVYFPKVSELNLNRSFLKLNYD